MQPLTEGEGLRIRQLPSTYVFKESAVGWTRIYGRGGGEQDVLAGAVIATASGIGEITIKLEVHHQVRERNGVGRRCQSGDYRDSTSNCARRIIYNERVVAGIT